METIKNIREQLIADIGEIRAELAKTRMWDSAERIADYLISKGWTLLTKDNNHTEPKDSTREKPYILLSRNVSLKEPKHNVMLIGCAGSGKTRHYILPNLLQCNGSYVVADLAGVLQEATRDVFERKGYEIITFDAYETTAEEIEAFNAAEIGRKPTIVYITLNFNCEENTKVLHPLVKKIITESATEIPIHMFLDEFCNIEKIPDFYHMLLRAKNNLSCSVTMQRITQLQNLYKDTWTRIVNCFDTLIYFGGVCHETYEFFSSLAPVKTVPVNGKGRGLKHAPATPVPDIRHLPLEDCFILNGNLGPIIDRKFDPTKHPNYIPY